MNQQPQRRTTSKKRDITLFDMYSGEVSKSIWRMDLESIVAVASTTLSCVVTALQILHTKRNREAPTATSITMLAVLASTRPRHPARAQPRRPARRQEQAARAALQRRPARAERVYAAGARADRPRAAAVPPAAQLASSPPSSGAERSALRVCLPLYVVEGAVAGVVHLRNSRAAREDLIVRLGPDPATVWGDLASYAGLVLDGFLLPQVVLNACSGSRATAILLKYVPNSLLAGQFLT
ncbi:hypothetical protein ACP4OV_024904 [Aristida adscensionis]